MWRHRRGVGRAWRCPAAGIPTGCIWRHPLEGRLVVPLPPRRIGHCRCGRGGGGVGGVRGVATAGRTTHGRRVFVVVVRVVPPSWWLAWVACCVRSASASFLILVFLVGCARNVVSRVTGAGGRFLVGVVSAALHSFVLVPRLFAPHLTSPHSSLLSAVSSFLSAAAPLFHAAGGWVTPSGYTTPRVGNGPSRGPRRRWVGGTGR